MNDYMDKFQYNPGNARYLLVGMLLGSLLGGLVGALAMLLLAPQPGVATRKRIRRKGRDLREKTSDAIEGGVGEVRAKAHHVATGLHDGAEALQQRGAEMVDHQKERLAPVVDAVKDAAGDA